MNGTIDHEHASYWHVQLRFLYSFTTIFKVSIIIDGAPQLHTCN